MDDMKSPVFVDFEIGLIESNHFASGMHVDLRRKKKEEEEEGLLRSSSFLQLSRSHSHS